MHCVYKSRIRWLLLSCYSCPIKVFNSLIKIRWSDIRFHKRRWSKSLFNYVGSEIRNYYQYLSIIRITSCYSYQLWGFKYWEIKKPKNKQYFNCHTSSKINTIEFPYYAWRSQLWRICLLIYFPIFPCRNQVKKSQIIHCIYDFIFFRGKVNIYGRWYGSRLYFGAQ